MAGSTLFSILGKLLLDASDYQKKTKETEEKTKTSTQKIGEMWSAVGANMMKTGGLMTAGITTPLVALGSSSASAASNMEESMNKVKVVFGETADSIIAFADNSAQAMGLSKQATLEYAGTFGNLFSAMGISDDATAEMSTGLITLASDLASFNNIPVTDALDKLRAGLVGETEPLRTLGVNLSAAEVSARAMAMGLGDAEGNLTAAELATARYALIMEQTSLAQGDFTRTSDGLANQQKIAAAEFENLKAILGASIIPVLNQLITALIPVIQKFAEMSPATQQTIVSVLAVLAALGPLITIIGSVVSVVGGLITAFRAGGAAATALGAVGTFLTGTVLPALGAAIAAIGLPVIALIAAIGALIFVIVTFGEDAKNTLYMIGEIIKVFAQQAADWLGGTLAKAFDAIGSAISGVIGWVQQMIDKLMSIKLPDWLTPGSPTPFELGLKGIAKEMAGLTNSELPQFTAGLEFDTGNGALTANIPSVNPANAAQDEWNSSRDVIDYDRLARVLRDALAQVM